MEFKYIYLFFWLPDVYYYLKDPPPEFLPRFGTITMAGLLGMFLARKGTLTRCYYKHTTTNKFDSIGESSINTFSIIT